MNQVGIRRASATRRTSCGITRLRSSATRTGERCSSPSRRQVSCGSSASTVAVPTRIASCVARSRCVRSRAAGPVIQRLSPEAVAIRPSSEVASFSVTSGRPVRTRWKNPALISAASSRAQPAFDGDPGLPQSRETAAGNPRVRVLDRSDDPAHPGRDQRLGARRRLPPVGARFERDIGRRAPVPRRRRARGPPSRHAAVRRAASNPARRPCRS